MGVLGMRGLDVQRRGWSAGVAGVASVLAALGFALLFTGARAFAGDWSLVDRSAGRAVAAGEGAGGLPVVLAGPAGEAAAPEAGPAREVPFEIAVIADTQSMVPLEWFVRGGRRERLLVRDKLRELRPDWVLLAGDAVGRGDSGVQWERFREEFAGLPVWPALGNHDLMGDRERALAHWFAAFPQLQGRRWYALRRGPLVVLVLDSNLRWLGEGERVAQQQWLEQELDRAEADPGVRAVALVAHHPPYSLQFVGGDLEVRESFWEPARRRSKFLVFLSGHHHCHQHLEIEGRHLFVVGGGGAPLFLRPRRDDLPPGAIVHDVRAVHHILRLRVESWGLRAILLELTPAGAWRQVYSHDLPWRGRVAVLH
ncbi:MAG: hypothetical protein KatS3mg102_2017 [Planctomycetota bacterium]|nr:MAG: hypothetical protein KatS3mg102_2017 [Planctomycetota bacterium]